MIRTVHTLGEAERKAGREGAFRDARLAWRHFWDSIWDKKIPFDEVQDKFDRGEHPIDDFSIEMDDPFHPPLNPESPPSSHTYNLVPPTREVMEMPEKLFHAWGANYGKVLIRSEYEEAEKAAILARGAGARVFLVTGQPGIGSSPFCTFTRF